MMEILKQASTLMRVVILMIVEVEKCPRTTNTKRISGKISLRALTTVSTQDSTNCAKTRSRAAEKPEEKIKNFHKTS